MYQLLIEDKNNKIRYLSSVVLSEKDLKQDIRIFAQQEHFLKHPDDKFLDKEFIDEIFKNIDIIGLVELNFKNINTL